MNSDNSRANGSLPSAEDICLHASLYSAYKLNLSGTIPADELLRKLRVGNFQFDGFCIHCDKLSTFKTMRAKPASSPAVSIHSLNSPRRVEEHLKYGPFTAEVSCQREISHKYFYFFVLEGFKGDGILQKVGQFPSLEDIATSGLQKYRKILGSVYFKELHRAGGLHSHGIGIGAFVYLRRIFERLIEKAHDRAINGGTTFSDFATARMDDKIGMLKDWLPPALVKNKAVYKILSKGLHELDEDTCRKHFPVMNLAIIDILEQDIAVEARRNAEEELAQAIQNVSVDLS